MKESSSHDENVFIMIYETMIYGVFFHSRARFGFYPDLQNELSG